LHRSVTQQFYRAAAAGLRLAAAQRLVDASIQSRDITKRRFSTAAASYEDVLGAEIDVARAEAGLARTRADILREQLALGELAGTSEPIVPLSDSLASIPLDSAFDSAVLVALALRVNPLMSAARLRVRVADRAIAAAQASYWPRLSLNLGYSRSYDTSNYDAFFQFNPPNQGFVFGLNADIPLFDRFVTNSSVEIARATSADAGLDERILELSIARTVRTDVIDLVNAARDVGVGQLTVRLARERLQLTQARYQAGAVSFPELQLVASQASDAEQALIDGLVTLALAREELTHAVGAPLP
jgi:outer membrane protein TolC